MPTYTKSTPGPFLRTVELARDRLAGVRGYPIDIPAINGLGTLQLHPKVTFLVGENGSGKSTLLEGIAVACGMNPEGGGKNFNFRTRDSHSRLGDYLKIGRPAAHAGHTFFLRAESFYNVATEVDNLGYAEYYGGKSLHHQSHGESFFALVQNRFEDNGLYFMDEPESALSPNRQVAFLALLHDYCVRGCQFVISTHSPILMAYPEATIYVLDSKGIHVTEYLETDHYRVTKGFLNNPEGMMAILTGQSQGRLDL